MSEKTGGELTDVHDAAHPSAGHQGHNTTPGAWVVVFVVIAATVAGGIGLVIWNFVLFWIAVAVTVLACLAGWAIGIMDQVTEYGGGGGGGDPGSTVPGNNDR